MTYQVGIDFEFFNSNERELSLVACVITAGTLTVQYNLLDEKRKQELKVDLLLHAEHGAIFVAYAVMAEARAFQALGLDPLRFKWKDLYVEFVMLCNSNDEFNYGKYIDGGVEQFSVRPDPELDEEERKASPFDHSETPKNLINCAYKLLGVRLDADEKEEMRTLILSKDLEQISARMDEILRYCESDTKHLLPLSKAIDTEFNKQGLFDFENDQLTRGLYSAAVARCETEGLPLDTLLLERIIENTDTILKTGQDEVNQYFPFFEAEYQRPPKTFKNGNVFHYKPTPAKKNTAAYQTYIHSLNLEGFPLTNTGKYKSDKKTLEEFANKHRYNNGLDYLLRYNITESSLKWFRRDNKNGFFERVGSDSRVRPYYGIFGTQTGRNAAKAKTFPLAMSSWLRAILQPPKGKVIIGADFSQQEVYVAAILSGDKNLRDAYESGDVYLAFAKQANLAPQDATKKTHKDIRDLCKSTVLGLQFGMGKIKLNNKLRMDSGKPITEEQTLELINAHKTTFKQYWEWVREISEQYKLGYPLVTNDGWVLFCDNPVVTSVRNFPVQANSASITRLAVTKCWQAGLTVLCSLHDAIYIEADEQTQKESQKLLETIMLEATATILNQKETTMRIDTKIVTHDKPWVEDKGRQDWEKLRQFFGAPYNQGATV